MKEDTKILVPMSQEEFDRWEKFVTVEAAVAAEREACAKVAERLAATFEKTMAFIEVRACIACAMKIRARGTST